jgi:uncharacterized protein involved in exopolysaccharide biosynthesis
MFTVDGADTSPKPAGPAPEPASGGLPVAPQRVALALKQRWRVLVACTAAAAALGAVAAKTIVPREFTATTVLSWEPAVGTQDAARELRSLVDAVELPDNLALVRERTALPLTLEAVGSSVTVATSAASNVISIVGTADAPEDAARIAEATAEVFLADRVRVARAQLGEKLSHLDDDAKAARNSVDLAHSAYDVFRTEEGLADPAAETLAAIEHTSRLRTEADLSRAALDSESARARSLAGAADTRPERTVLAQKEVRPVAEKLAVERTELAARRARLSEDHPQVAALAAEVESLERRGTTKDAAIAERTVGQDPTRAALDQELARTRAEVEASRTRGTAYASLLATAEARLERLSGLSHRAAALTADIRSAESHLAEVETERARTRDAFRAPPTGFRVIAHAIVPSLPSSSLRRPVAALSPLLGLLIGLVLALVRSPRLFRVATATELCFWGRAPVLASSSWPAEAPALELLVQDLSESLPAEGLLLVLGLDAEGTALAERLGAELLGVSARDVCVSSADTRGSVLAVATLRRRARAAARVLVVARAEAHAGLSLWSLGARLGRSDGLGFVLTGVGPELATLSDRVGDLARFRAATLARSAP